MSHEPLSRSLERVTQESGIQNLNDLVARTRGRGIFLVMIVLCLPFISPVPVPGLSNVVGLALFVVSVRLFLGLPSRLPHFIGSRPWPASRMERVTRASLCFLRWLERVVKPRRSAWLVRPAMVRLNAVVLGFLSLLLALPIPPIIPFSNSLPAHGIILLSASMMEEDGAAIWVAYAIGVATVVYLGLFAGAIIRFIVIYEERIWNFLRQLL
jgi:hypothetical protein